MPLSTPAPAEHPLTGTRPSIVVHRLALALSCAYLIESHHGLLLVDAGVPGEAQRILRAIRRLQPGRLLAIFITHAHFDHYGSAAELRRLTTAPIAVHRADAQALADGETPVVSARGRGRIGLAALRLAERFACAPRTVPDVCLEDGQQLEGLGWPAAVLHTPGHTPGSSCLIVDGRLAFAGDLVTTDGGGHAQRYFAVDWAQLPGSLARLQALHPEWTYAGHGRSPLDHDALQQVKPARI